jgi:tetratricopeptide (TPR) repeat protein
MHKPDALRQAFDDIFRLIRSGQLEQAEQKCSSVLIEYPQDANIIGLHGAILLKLGHEDDAQQALHKAIALEPGFAKPHEDLGRLFLARKEPERAARHFKQAIQLDGGQASAYSGLANALAQLGKPVEAKAAHQEFLQRSPVASTLLEADKLLREGDGAVAEQLCNELLQREPDNTQILRMLARIASDGERSVVAEKLLRRIINLSPNEYLSHIDLGRFLVEQGRFPEAVEMFEHAVSLNDKVADNFRLLGDAQAVIGRSADALASYQLALHLHPGDPHALAGQGHMQRIAGNRVEAIASYEKCTAVQPEFGDAWWSLASLRGYQLSDEQIQTIHSQITSGDLSVDSEIAMRFALARTSEARGNFDVAWQDYCLGNSLKREQINYDPVQTEVKHDAIIERLTGDFLDRGIPAPALQHTPIFILGMPRSGSTLLEQILASHSMVEGTGELPYIVMLSSSLGRQRPDGLRYPEVMSELTEEQLESLGKAYIYHSRAHRGLDLPCFTDKMPANFSHVGLISMILPNAKIIDARRHPMGTCVANYRQLYAQGKNQTYDLVDFAEYFLEYIRIMDHWQEVLPGRVLRVQYEDVVADLEGQARRMLDYCQLPWEDACLDFHRNARPVNTASAEQVREPIYTDAVEFWKHYESQLESIREILAPVMPH